MAFRNRLRRQFQIEGLEKRDTPSALAGGIAEIQMERARPPRPHIPPKHINHPKPPKKPPVVHYRTYAAPFTGSGTALLSTLTQTSASGTMTGTLTVPKRNPLHASFGAYSGSLTVNLSPTGPVAVGQFNLPGGVLVLSFNLSGSLAQGSFSGNFTVAGGTGKFAHTTGTGTVSALLNPATESASLTLNGNLHVGVPVR